MEVGAQEGEDFLMLRRGQGDGCSGFRVTCWRVGDGIGWCRQIPQSVGDPALEHAVVPRLVERVALGGELRVRPRWPDVPSECGRLGEVVLRTVEGVLVVDDRVNEHQR